VTEFANPQLTAWESFYVIVGSSGAALIGVQFVVIALIANRRTLATAEAIRAFATPTVVHLGAGLLVSAIMSAPWPSPLPASVALALAALFLRTTMQPPLFVVAGAALGLLLIGIHNAWDSVTHIVVQGSRETE